MMRLVAHPEALMATLFDVADAWIFDVGTEAVDVVDRYGGFLRPVDTPAPDHVAPAGIRATTPSPTVHRPCQPTR